MRLTLSLLLFAFAATTSLVAEAQIKNPRSIMNGALTRAGNKGMKELNDQQLKALCEEGYSSAYFMYSGAKTRTITCSSGSITYRSTGLKSAESILVQMRSNIEAGRRTFVHCYNGAHASGVVAALALRQFCGASGQEAFSYWDKNLGGYALQEANVRAVRARLTGFVPSSSLTLSPAQQSQLCH